MSISSSDLEFLQSFVAKQSGNVLRTGQVNLIESQLTPVAVEQGLNNVEELIGQLRRAHSPVLSDQVAEAVTVNETSFFRDSHPFEVLHKKILPELVRANPNQKIRIWCAASSTGQEPLSIAMSIRENLPHLSNIQILATDLSEEVLSKCREGTYSQLEVNRGLPIKKLVRFFDRVGNTWKAKSELLDMIEFRRLNLVEQWPYLGHFDVAFIRNVLIYFDRPMKSEILRRAHSVLNSQGYLFIGSAETIIGLGSPFRREEIDATVCYRPE